MQFATTQVTYNTDCGCSEWGKKTGLRARPEGTRQVRRLTLLVAVLFQSVLQQRGHWS
jgi:hypothetical protein